MSELLEQDETLYILYSCETCHFSVSRIRDSVPFFDAYIQDTGWVQSQDPDPGSGSGIRIRDNHPGSYFRERRKQFFGLKILKFFDADADPGFGMFLIRDPGWKNSDPG